MLRMTDLPKKGIRKRPTEEQIMGQKAELEPKLLTISNLPSRGRRIKPIELLPNAPPAKILTISDLPRRTRAARKVAAAAAVRKPVMAARRLRIQEQMQTSLGPEIFANYVPNGTWSGRRCFIIGGGPSLKRCNLDGLAGELVIGINRAYELLDPSILYGVDPQLFGWAVLGKLGEESRKKFEAYKGFKAWMSLPKTCYPADFSLIGVDSRTDHKIGTTKHLSFKNNSGYGALNLAAAMGVKEIYLLGFDMQGDKRGKQRWWHDGYPLDYGGGIYAKYVKEITGLAPVLAKAGIKVVNLNRKSGLKCFPFGDLRTVLSNKPDRPIVVSFYTLETGYVEEANRLIKELHLFGLEHDIQGISSFGSWQKNTQYKAKFIAGMMEKYPKRNILWLDVDSSIHQYPDVFDNADFDLGVHKIDWQKYTHGRRKDKQLANAVIYLKNIDKVRRFVHAWVRLNEEQPDRIEMQTMADILSKWESQLKFHNIPASYCQIYDLMFAEGRPVIEQRQASRMYRDKVGIKDPVVEREKKKYDNCWSPTYKGHYVGPSKCARPLIQHVLKTMRKGDKVLDIGCGDCTTVIGLREAGVDCMGVDISLVGVPHGLHGIFGAPIWNMPFDDNQFDYTVSSDVLEHVPPEKISASIKEIFRVTKRKTFNVVALFDGILNGVVLHMTVKPIEWWIDQFAAVNKGNGKEDMVVMARSIFMAGYGGK